uniref:Uncharacterized protein n=1 Tax=Arundo donax TaxID=35708 RepID=A0A0A9B413_ARUDO
MEDRSDSIICLIIFYIQNHSLMPIGYNLQIITPSTDYHMSPFGRVIVSGRNGF